MTNTKILIASDGEETHVLYNGVELPGGDTFAFRVTTATMVPEITMANISISEKFGTEEDFFRSVERILGYKLCNK